MKVDKVKFNSLTGEFESKRIEFRYRQVTFKKDLKLNELAIVAIAIANILFIYNDLMFFSNSPALFWVIVFRIGFTLFSLICLALLIKAKRFTRFDNVLGLWLSIFLLQTLCFAAIQPNENESYVLTDVLSVIGVYILFIFRLVAQILLALVFSIASIFIIILMKNFAEHSVFTIIISYVIANVLSIAIAFRLHIIRRIDFYRRETLTKQAKTLSLVALKDPLTGLWNRRSYDERMAATYDDFVRYEREFSIIIIDLDRFKRVNDSFGHDVGDKVLVEFARILMGSARPGDTIFRLGGEEFVVLLQATNIEKAWTAAERIRIKLTESLLVEEIPELKVTASFGCAQIEKEDSGVRHIFHRADKALYIAKHSGRNQVVRN